VIPTHQSDKTIRREIIVNQLSTLNEYDFDNPHRHDYFEFFCFIKGGGHHVIDFKKIPIESFSIHIVTPGQVHQVNRELDSNGFVYLFELGALEAPAPIHAFLFDHICYGVEELSPSYLFGEEQAPLLQFLTDTIWKAQTEKSALNQLTIQNAIQSLCIKCMETRGVEGKKQDSEYAAFRKLLFENYRSLKKVKDYAETLNISEKGLNEIVKSNTGMSTSQVIYNQIILEAKRLLQTGMSAKEAAYDLNFDDPAHFSKFFKSKTGYSPTEFRNVHA
jgi:AraC-like DNA-binding protein